MLCYTVLYCTILYHTIPCHIIAVFRPHAAAEAQGGAAAVERPDVIFLGLGFLVGQRFEVDTLGGQAAFPEARGGSYTGVAPKLGRLPIRRPSRNFEGRLLR